jgi:hypothetical protein
MGTSDMFSDGVGVPIVQICIVWYSEDASFTHFGSSKG